MNEALLAVGCLVILGLVLWFQERAHAGERKEWTRERQALLERAVPGVVLTERVETENGRVYGTDEDEYRVERQRRRAWSEDA